MVDMVYCSGCGNQIHKTALSCPSCGAVTQANIKKSNKSKVVAGLLALFFGGLGVHKFYLGQIGLGVLYLVCTILGLFLLGIPTLIIAIVSFIEAIVYFCSSDENFDKKYNK
ncbi:TM2 domain-containing protein [Orbus wheelerorum]|uniref:TM2 domain-containing protein n=1 Tax=Orbus wheelerorum TaxID=3074111 RepID=UPI00370D05B3